MDRIKNLGTDRSVTKVKQCNGKRMVFLINRSIGHIHGKNKSDLHLTQYTKSIPDRLKI